MLDFSGFKVFLSSLVAWSKLMNNFLLHNAYNSLFRMPLRQKSYDRQLKWKTKALVVWPENSTNNFSQKFETTNRTTMNCAFHAGRRYGKSGRISNFFPMNKEEKIISMKTYFYVCLLEWKTWQSSTNNKLWWFLNDSTDFHGFFSSVETMRPVNEAKTKTNLFFMEKIFCHGKK